jgi:hypothetical protein
MVQDRWSMELRLYRGQPERTCRPVFTSHGDKTFCFSQLSYSMLSLSISFPSLEPVFDSWADATTGSNHTTRTIDQQFPPCLNHSSHLSHHKPNTGLDYKA